MNYIAGILTVFIVINCLILILLVLIQLPKKDAGAGLAFGGGAADALFGAGSGNALTKITKWAIGIFFVLALALGYVEENLHSNNTSAFEKSLATTAIANASDSVADGSNAIDFHAARSQFNNSGINARRACCYGHKHSGQINADGFFQTRSEFFSEARFVFLVAASVLISSCAPHDPRADITIVDNGEPETLDPALLTGIPEMRIVIGMFEGLARLDPKTAQPIPGLAQSWDISPDGTIYTFHLRTNLVWSTGEPITADDVVYSWIRTLNPATASAYAGQLFYVKNAEDFNAGKIKDASLVGISAPDKYTVRVELKQPTPFFIDICAMPLTDVVPRQTIEKFGDRWLMAKPLPSSGPYEMVYWKLNDKVRLKKNPRYWDAANTQSDVIDILPMGSPSTSFDLYEQGGVDIIWDKEVVPADLLDILLKRPDAHRFDYLATYWISFNTTRKPFDDPRVRKALALAVDRDSIVKKIGRGGERPTTHIVPDGTANYTSPPGLDYNPVLAKKLLAEAGYPDGKGFPRFDYIFNAAAGGGVKTHEDIAVELQQMWHDTLGINMDLRPVEWKVWLSSTAHLDYDVGRGDWIGDYDDANTFLALFQSNDGNNRIGWKNPRYDLLINEGNAQADVKKREALFQQAESMLVRDELPVIPLYIFAGMNYYHTNISGIYQNILDDHPLNYIRKTANR